MDRHPSGPLDSADRTLVRTRGSNTYAAGRSANRTLAPCRTPARIEHLRGRPGLGSNRSVLLHATDRTPAQAPKPRIEHLRRRSIPWIETLWSRRTHGSTPFRPDPCHGSTPFAGAGRADRHPSGPREPADRTLAGRADRTLAQASETRIEHLPDARIEHLRGLRGRGSTPFGVAGRADRHPLRPDPCHGSTPFAGAGRADRHPSGPLDPADRTLAGRADRTLAPCSTPARIEHLPGLRGSDRTDPVRSIPGSRPFGVAGRADRHPSGPLDPADRTLAGRADRTLTRPGGVRIEHLHPAPRPRIEHLRGPRERGSNRSGPLDPVDRDPSESPGARIDTLPAGSAPWIDTLRGRRSADRHPSAGSIPWIDTLPRRRIDTLRGHRIARIDTPFAGSIPWIEILRGRRGADRRLSRSPAGANPGGRPAGLRSPRSDLPPCGSPPGSTAPEPRNTK